jgi:hypothetical protein
MAQRQVFECNSAGSDKALQAEPAKSGNNWMVPEPWPQPATLLL